MKLIVKNKLRPLQSFFLVKKTESFEMTSQLRDEIISITRECFPHSLLLSQKVLQKFEDPSEPAFMLWENTSEEDQVLIGYVIGSFLPTSLKISYLAVSPQYQRGGFGTILMKKMFEIANESNLFVTLKYQGFDRNLCKFYSSFDPVDKNSTSWLMFFDDANRPVFDPKISLKSIEMNHTVNGALEESGNGSFCSIL